MIRNSFLILFSLLAISCSTDKATIKPYNTGINLTPFPSELAVNDGSFILNKNTTIYIDGQSDELQKTIELFTTKIKNSTGFVIALESLEKENQIRTVIDNNLDIKDEGYLFKSDNKGIEIKAKDATGVFYAMQTMMQLLPAEIESPSIQKNIQWIIPSVEIRDEPRFAYRGFLIDSGRHFWSVDFIKKQLELMAMLKINKFHWHLTEDQGWRIEIKKYPKLTQIGALRKEHDGTTYGPYYYTQEEIKEVVAFAKDRFIEVIPEIDMPGHAIAAVAAYPEYSCTGGPHDVRNVWGISSDIFCAGNEKTYTFIEDIFNEILPLFESDYIHLGGDEANKYQWERCSKCQQKVKELKLVSDKEASAENKLQSYFMARVESYLAKSGKKIIGWEEMVDGNLPPTATVMSWRGIEKGLVAANMGNNVIMAPRPWVYLDQIQGDSKLLPPAPTRYVPLEKTYSLDPIPEALDSSRHHQILGVQAAIWAEYVPTEELFEWYTYPRLIALSEIAWSKPENKNYTEFLTRLNNQRVRLDMHNVNYYIPLPQQKGIPSSNFVAFTTNTTLEFDTTEPVTILYTLDGTEPNEKSAVYEAPLTFDQTSILNLRSLLPSGKLGKTRTIRIDKQDFAPSVEKNADDKELRASYYTGFENKVGNLSSRTPDSMEVIAEPQQSKCRIENNILLTAKNAKSVIIEGYINIPTNAVYYFSTDCDQFWINDNLLISNEGEIKRNSNNDRSIALAKGHHQIKLIRLANICGGWVPQWQPVSLSIRDENETKFRVMNAEDFK